MDQVTPESHPEDVDVCAGVEPENIPLPTSSMITVRLSDIPVFPDIDEDLEPTGSQEGSLRQSPPSSTRSSRSSSQTSESSASIPSVDWEGLEKTEEQESKDESTDDVSPLFLRDGGTVDAEMNSLPLFYSLV